MHQLIKIFKKSLLSENYNFFSENVTYSEYPFFIKLLKEENLDYLFYLKSKASNEFIYSKDAIKSVEKEYRIEAGIQLIQIHEISRIIGIFKTIPVCFIKGSILGYWLELDLYKRSSDIDLLIEKGNVKKAIRLLNQIGYELIPSRSYGEFSMKNKHGILLDVHYDLAVSSPFKYISEINISEILKNQKDNALINNIKIPTFSKEITFVHLCIHFCVNHHFNNFILLYELLTFFNKKQHEMDWEFIYNYSTKYKQVLILQTNLLILDKIYPGILEKKFLIKFLQESKSLARAQSFIDKYSIIDNLLSNKKNNIGHLDIALFCTDNFYKIIFLIKGYIRRMVKDTS